MPTVRSVVIVSFSVSQAAYREEPPGTSQEGRLGEEAAGQAQGEVSSNESCFIISCIDETSHICEVASSWTSFFFFCSYHIQMY